MLNPNVVVKNIVNQDQVNTIVSTLARVLVAYIFIVVGYGKISGYEATAGYMEAMGVPSALLPLTILVEL